MIDVWLKEGLYGELSNVLGCDQLQSFILKQVLSSCRQHIAREIWSDVVHERHGSQDGPTHLPAKRRLGHQMLLDIVFADEMGNVGESFDELVASTID